MAQLADAKRAENIPVLSGRLVPIYIVTLVFLTVYIVPIYIVTFVFLTVYIWYGHR